MTDAPSPEATSKPAVGSSEEEVIAFKGAMRRLASGVAILTTNHQGRRFGMTATALMSLSMAPPSLAVAINRNASIYEALTARKSFCVNLLHERHAELCHWFSAVPAADRFQTGAWAEDADGLPYLKDSEASIACAIGPVLDFGSHTIFVGQVLRTILGGSCTPLVYLNGATGAVRPCA
jgi:flavin reductase